MIRDDDTEWAKKMLSFTPAPKGEPRVIVKQKLYVNAFCGGIFDHHFLKKAIIEAGDVTSSLKMNGSNIMCMEYKKMRFVDLQKHLGGSLSKNLADWGCEVQKGSFNHDLGCRWEVMGEATKKQCLSYLKSDVLGLAELSRKYSAQVKADHDTNWQKHISGSAMTWSNWVREGLGEFEFHDRSRSRWVVQLPNREMDRFFRESIRGGRTYKTKSRFKSRQYDEYLSGKLSYDDLRDYYLDPDAVSLYPTAMLSEYPVGLAEKLEPGESKMRGKMGIYKIRYKTNKFLAHSISGSREKGGKLSWTLEDGEGVYTSIDIEDMVKHGYEVEILGGYYWTKTAKIFKTYIEKLYKRKNSAKKGTCAYSLAKIMMNALYGKTIQKPIYDEIVEFTLNKEYWALKSTHDIQSIQEVMDSNGEVRHWLAFCRTKDELKLNRKVTKPCHIGSFILAYSRRIMLEFMTEANPNFDISKKGKLEEQVSQDWGYGDTDSLHMHADQAALIKKFGCKELGGMTDDLGGSKVIQAIWIAPKTYALAYVRKPSQEDVLNSYDLKELRKIAKSGGMKGITSNLGKGELLDKMMGQVEDFKHVEAKGGLSKPRVHYHLKGKGLALDKLTWGHFVRMDQGEAVSNTRDYSMRRKGASGMFAIEMLKGDGDKKALTRTINSKPWRGRAFSRDGSVSLPWGYAGITRQMVEQAVVNYVSENESRERHTRKQIVSHIRKLVTASIRKVDKTTANIFENSGYLYIKHEKEEIIKKLYKNETSAPPPFKIPNVPHSQEIEELRGAAEPRRMSQETKAELAEQALKRALKDLRKRMPHEFMAGIKDANVGCWRCCKKDEMGFRDGFMNLEQASKGALALCVKCGKGGGASTVEEGPLTLSEELVEADKTERVMSNCGTENRLFVHWNCNGGGIDSGRKHRAVDEVVAILEREHPNFLGISEPKSDLSDWPEVAGYEKLGGGRVIGYLARTSGFRHVEELCTAELIVLDGPARRLYYAYQSNDNPSVGQDGINTLKWISADMEEGEGRSHMLLGDLNAHSPTWNPCIRESDKRGALLEQIQKREGLVLLNGDLGPTYKKIQKGKVTCSTIDLAFVSPDWAEKCMARVCPTHLSDHQIVMVRC
jgi:hypothetical protein